MVWIAVEYFVAYLPYAALVKALSGGYLPGGEVHQGLTLLPAAAIGQLLAMPLFLGLSGWWRYGTRRAAFRRRLLFPTGATLAAGFFTAIVVGTTTLNLSFPGVSILFMLLLMRAGTLIVAPIVDKVDGRHVHGYSWAAVGLSLVAITIALADVASYALSGWAILSVAAYVAAYANRFRIMGRQAKTGVKQVDRRYFVGEHVTAPIFLFALLGCGALLGQPQLREGFTSLLTSSAALPAIGIGVSYELLFICGTLIYLDYDEHSWTVPINRCASLLSGLVVSVALAALTPAAVSNLPGRWQLLSLVAVLGAVVVLSYPAIRGRLAHGTAARSAGRPRPRTVLFVCGANTCRSPVAEAVAWEEIALTRSAHVLQATSAGLNVTTVGGTMTPAAVTALGELGIEVRHRPRALTVELCRSADVVYCMTRRQRDDVVAMAPDIAERTFCLDPRGDVADPHGQSLAAHRLLVAQVREAVQSRLTEQRSLVAGPPPAWAGRPVPT
jgi:protein-tyrosine-phosphatase